MDKWWYEPVCPAHLKFVLFAVNNDSTDLLVHEDENSHEESGDKAGHVHPPRILPKRHHQPASIWACGLVEHRRLFKLLKVLTLYKKYPICTVNSENVRIKIYI